MAHPAIENMLKELERIKEQYGEAAYQRSANQAAKLLIRQGGEIEKVAREVLQGVVDFEAIDKEPLPKTGMPADQMRVEAMRQQMPGIQTQAQFNLLKALDTAGQVTELSEKLGHVPEAATSKEAEQFKQPPLQFGEYDVQKTLLTELVMITTADQFNEWYAANRTRIDQVVSPHFRNPLFDAIRAKRATFAQPAAES